MANPQWGEFLTSTLRRRRNKIAWQILGNRFLTWFLYNRGQVRKVAGGASILEPLVYGESSGITWFDGADPVGTTFNPRMTAAEYDWHWGSAPITINFTEQWKNRGKDQLFDMLKTRTKQAEISFRNNLNKALLGTNSGNAKQTQGLEDFFDRAAVGAQTSTVGGISKASYTYWNNQYQDVAGDFANNGEDRMEDLFLDCSVGGLHPDVILGTRAFWQNYHKAIKSQRDFHVRGVPEEVADTQFRALEFFGVPVVWDDDVTADTAYFLTVGGKPRKLGGQESPLDMGKTNEEDIGHLRLAVHDKVDFMMMEAEKPHGQFQWVSYITWGGNIVCNNMSVQGILDNVDTYTP